MPARGEIGSSLSRRSAGAAARSCRRMSPTIATRMSSSVTTPVDPAVFVDDDGQ
jgi:hypothetical protein